jgi:ABC-type Fe3+/spermidine/putrescine transport system ATPase subunit
MKKCSKCEIEKELTEFKRYSVCIDCYKISNKIYNDSRKEKMKEYYQENKNFLKDRSKEYYNSNKDYIIDRNTIYAKNNKEKTNQYKYSYRSRKIKESYVYKLSVNIRSLISITIRNNGYKKKSKTIDILGTTFENFKIYIEGQFKDGMSWENHGEWHLDHKKPISWAETEEEIYELNHYTNFQPLWSFDNLSKGNRYSH